MKGMDLTGRVAVVTGGARGIGRATAAALRDAGARVAIGDIDADELATTAGQLGVLGGYLDVTDPYSIAGFRALVEEQIGPIDVWVNNAGIMPVGSLLEQDPRVIRRSVEINLLGVIECSRIIARGMVTRGGGRIVNIASVAGRIPAAGMAVYSGTKFGVVGFGEALDAELCDSDVRVSTVLPSFAATELIDGLQPGRGMDPVPPQRIADTVVKVLRKGKRSAVVPRRLSGASAAWMHLPRPLARWLSRQVGLDRVFLTSNAGRAAYDRRIAKGRTS
ncbi:SDR family oxidoreductase [Nocardia sp. NEAU-G5]|uniref:SDR family oxidoreductase n=2 Tax=Nocardia albiluteola TaxID=2842303 RepID=A0ABS6AWR9_9NOCA|nr:SDR family oxidoreductase [Nocardia albiluteola]MBU3065656.1 SDR family oxidoreductase [Nocardia albiluteola]